MEKNDLIPNKNTMENIEDGKKHGKPETRRKRWERGSRVSK